MFVCMSITFFLSSSSGRELKERGNGREGERGRGGGGET